MSRFHILESLLASIDGELCRLLKELSPHQTDDNQTFDKIWIPYLDILAELAKMHMDIMQHFSGYLINMTDFDKMCKTIDTICSSLGIPELKRLPDSGNTKILSAMHLSKQLEYIFRNSSTVWKQKNSLRLWFYTEAMPHVSMKYHLEQFVTQRIEVCDRVISRFQWYIKTLQILSRNFESLDQTRIVETILKPSCRIFRIPETSTLDRLIERATELLRIKEHPEPFTQDIVIAVTNMIREVELAKRRKVLHDMMSKMYSSEPTLSEKEHVRMVAASGTFPDFHPSFYTPIKPHNFQTRLKLQSPHSWAYHRPMMSYGEAVNFEEQAAATKIQRMYKMKTKSNKRKEPGHGGKRRSTKARQTRNA